jgi:hypothetical protein
MISENPGGGGKGPRFLHLFLSISKTGRREQPVGIEIYTQGNRNGHVSENNLFWKRRDC